MQKFHGCKERKRTVIRTNWHTHTLSRHIDIACAGVCGVRVLLSLWREPRIKFAMVKFKTVDFHCNFSIHVTKTHGNKAKVMIIIGSLCIADHFVCIVSLIWWMLSNVHVIYICYLWPRWNCIMKTVQKVRKTAVATAATAAAATVPIAVTATKSIYELVFHVFSFSFLCALTHNFFFFFSAA